MITLNEKQKEFVSAAQKMGITDTITSDEVLKVAKSIGINFKPQWLTRNPELRVGRGEYKLPVDGLPKVEKSVNTSVLNDTPAPVTETAVANETQKEAAYVISSLTGDIVPKKDDTFVSFGNHPDVRSIIKSKQFYPIFITGLSGNGKTFSVIQACAESKREMIRVNITIETDEDDLLGGYRLKDGHTVWQNGPVIEAMERGAVLLLDEIDLASNKIMCLQPILEGNGVYVKKINKFVKPAKGFNVVATANTKGQGSDDGKFIGTNILNEAFLERFPVTFEQKYPTTNTEQKILNNTLALSGKKDTQYVEKLSTWADVIRKTYFDGGVDEIISTRRLVHIVQAYKMFGQRLKAIQMCVSRFDSETKATFLDLYTKVDAQEVETETVDTVDVSSDYSQPDNVEESF